MLLNHSCRLSRGARVKNHQHFSVSCLQTLFSPLLHDLFIQILQVGCSIFRKTKKEEEEREDVAKDTEGRSIEALVGSSDLQICIYSLTGGLVPGVKAPKNLMGIRNTF